ncbi:MULTISPECIES: DUF397 domain-containing protein [unclassified Streptomyces]|uniref:DUF397 domain-containing protein n=1 Tax=unclassified Streptomyces TaxID=2593676 RepID=UPI002256C8A0|nr:MULTISPECIES: DUF397 domain-containing protein [unclassified Streptomyces]MCX4993268.1 DUF397 domain-containing protein [Streptomyces sp. NBC_00568]MCX5009296.1 DUF397 domain-containing protein [Streptomyces sp. NBC_00638]
MKASGKGGDPWRKSTYSGGAQGNCLEVRFLGDDISIRDSANASAMLAHVSAPAWNRFVQAVREGHLSP